MNDFLAPTSGWKTYLAAAGLFGLAVWEISQSDYQHGVEHLLAALAAVGLRHAIGQAWEDGK